MVEKKVVTTTVPLKPSNAKTKSVAKKMPPGARGGGGMDCVIGDLKSLMGARKVKR